MSEEFKCIFQIILAFGVGLLMPFTIFVVYPFFSSLAPENRFERYLANQCIQGNEIAIAIHRKGGTRFISHAERQLVRAAIQGNPHAIKALGLDK